MRVFACKDLDGECKVIRGNVEPQYPSDFQGRGDWGNVMLNRASEPYCRDLAPGTFRELKRLDVVSGEFEFVEEVKVPTLLEAVKAHIEAHYPKTGIDGLLSGRLPGTWSDLAQSYKRELSKPAPRYEDKLIDELLEVGEASGSLGALLRGNATRWTDPSNRRAAEILQSLKRAKEGVK